MTPAVCSCCGEVPELGSVQLQCHREIEICYRCLDWLNDKRDKQMAASDGGVRIVGVEPIFRAANMERSADHYQRLGFSISYHDGTYAFAHRYGRTIHLDQTDEPPDSGALYLHVDDADQLADDWRKAGLQVVGPEDFDWGKHEGSHTDPDGNLIRFGSPVRRSGPE
jgi:hypothetical protein